MVASFCALFGLGSCWTDRSRYVDAGAFRYGECTRHLDQALAGDNEVEHFGGIRIRRWAANQAMFKLRRGAGGIRPQIVNLNNGELEMGDKTIVGDRVIFNTTPSPGASVCLQNAERDALRLMEFMPEFRLDIERLRAEFGVSDPIAAGQSPPATATADPLDEPPATRCVFASHGFHGAPIGRLRPQPPNANSTMWVLPSGIMPAAVRRSTAVAV